MSALFTERSREEATVVQTVALPAAFHTLRFERKDSSAADSESTDRRFGMTVRHLRCSYAWGRGDKNKDKFGYATGEMGSVISEICTTGRHWAKRCRRLADGRVWLHRTDFIGTYVSLFPKH